MNDPLDLNIDLDGVKTGMPRLQAGDYLCAVKTAEILANKAGTGHNLLVVFKTLEEAVSQDGDSLGAGMEVRKYYPLQQSANENAPDFRRDLAVLYDAAFKIEDENDRPPINKETIASLVQEEVLVKVSFEHDDQYGAQNTVRRVLAVD